MSMELLLGFILPFVVVSQWRLILLILLPSETIKSDKGTLFIVWVFEVLLAMGWANIFFQPNLWLIFVQICLTVALLACVLADLEHLRLAKSIHSRNVKIAGPQESMWSPDPIVAYRFTINSLGGEPYLNEPARCRVGVPHRSPVWGCTCGYYATKKSYCELNLNSHLGSHITVVCLLWGRVIETERGYRAERMKPIALCQQLGPFYYHPGLGQWQDLPRIECTANPKELEAIVEKAIQELDASDYTPYDGGHHGHRQTPKEDRRTARAEKKARRARSAKEAGD